MLLAIFNEIISFDENVSFRFSKRMSDKFSYLAGNNSVVYFKLSNPLF